MNSQFVITMPPFDRLRDAERERLLAAMDIHFFPQGSKVLTGGGGAEFLYIVFKGVVRQEDADGVMAMLGPQEFFDAEALTGGACAWDYVVVEDALCYVIPRQLFLEFSRENVGFQEFFSRNLAQKVEELREMSGCGDLNPLVTGRVNEIDPRPLLTVAAGESIRHAAWVMREQQVDVLLVAHDQGDFGLITAAMIRDAVALDGFDASQPVVAIAEPRFVAIGSDEPLFNAVLQMTRHQLSRLVVERQGKPVGVLELVDLLSHLSNHTHLVVRRIDRATTLEGLQEAVFRLPFTVRTLSVRGVKVRYISRLMGELNRHALVRLVALLAPPEIAENCALLVMGSEGRGEQLLKTDQDNALLLRDGFTHPGLQGFRERLGHALVMLGYPLCAGGVMLTRDAWCSGVTGFKQRVRGWIRGGAPGDLLNLAIFCDAVTVVGDMGLLQAVREDLFVHLPDDPAFFARFAQPAVAFDTPLGLFSRLISGQDGGVDIKKGGIFPIVHGIRALALEQRLPEVNTLVRIRGLTRLGVFDATFANDVIEAFDFMSGLRLRNMLDHGELYRERHDHIDVDGLTSSQRELLKDSLHTVNRLKKLLVHHFRLHLLG